MIFYGLDFAFVPKSPDRAQEIEMRAGTHQVPVLLTPENWMIADTTPLLQLLDSRVPRRALFPAGPLGVIVHLIEEYFDEWIARTMVQALAVYLYCLVVLSSLLIIFYKLTTFSFFYTTHFPHSV